MVTAGFAERLVEWQRVNGRHGLPWQGTRDAYRIWVSEIMLQQTQVTAVVPYYRRFMTSYPDVGALAAAAEDEVMQHWSGLGYYARARNLHRAAKAVMCDHGGVFPRSAAVIESLPGIGRSTAAAIAAFAFGERGAILDGNVKRVLARHVGIEGWPGDPKVQARLWTHAQALLPDRDIDVYTQAQMDLGSLVCVRGKPRCGECPVRTDCVAHREQLTASIPGRRPAKALPHRRIALLLCLQAGTVLIEKRPPTGVWGGLWSLPETDGADAASIATAAARYGVDAADCEALAPFEHGFTHFTLALEPWLVRTGTVRPEAREGGRRWLALEDAAGAALPAPIKRLLRSLAQASGGLFSRA